MSSGRTTASSFTGIAVKLKASKNQIFFLNARIYVNAQAHNGEGLLKFNSINGW